MQNMELRQVKELNKFKLKLRPQQIPRKDYLLEDMLLLRPGSEISISIIDGWATIVNYSEGDRVAARLFAST